jgi:hypothetical protein
VSLTRIFAIRNHAHGLSREAGRNNWASAALLVYVSLIHYFDNAQCGLGVFPEAVHIANDTGRTSLAVGDSRTCPLHISHLPATCRHTIELYIFRAL